MIYKKLFQICLYNMLWFISFILHGWVVLLLVGSGFIILQAEEKLRTIHEKKCKQLKRMDERSADAYKIDSTQSLIWGLSTKMKISIQVIDRVSITINKLRDEEFLQQINKLILGYVIIPTSQKNIALVSCSCTAFDCGFYLHNMGCIWNLAWLRCPALIFFLNSHFVLSKKAILLVLVPPKSGDSDTTLTFSTEFRKCGTLLFMVVVVV